MFCRGETEDNVDFRRRTFTLLCTHTYMRIDFTASMFISLTISYILWAIGGLFGWHLIYLGEPARALLYASTLGGGGVLWISDLFLLPVHVRAAAAASAVAASGGNLPAPNVAIRFLRTVVAATSAFVLARIYAAAVANFFVFTDGADVGDLTVGGGRAAAHAALAFASVAAAAVAGAAWGVRVPVTQAAVVCGATLVAAAARGSGAPAAAEAAAERLPTGLIAGYSAATAVLLSVALHAVAPPPLPSARARVSYAGPCLRSVLSLTAAGAFWVILLVGCVAQARMPVSADGLRFDAGSWRSEKVGVYVWRHRAWLASETLAGAKWLHAEVGTRGSLGEVLGDILFRAARSWARTAASAAGGGAGGAGDLFRGSTRARYVAADCATLGLPSPPPLPAARTVRRAYRRVAQRTHPDRLPPEASPEERLRALESFRDVHTAYERLLEIVGGPVAASAAAADGGVDENDDGDDGSNN